MNKQQAAEALDALKRYSMRLARYKDYAPRDEDDGGYGDYVIIESALQSVIEAGEKPKTANAPELLPDMTELQAALEQTENEYCNAAMREKPICAVFEAAHFLLRNHEKFTRDNLAFHDASLSEDQINHMVDRFLGWELPNNFNPDGGISFERFGNEGTLHQFERSPCGTNLFDWQQAQGMVRYMIDGLPIAPQPPAQKPQGVDVEGLKERSHSNGPYYRQGWNDCIDHLQQQGYLTMPEKPSRIEKAFGKDGAAEIAKDWYPPQPPITAEEARSAYEMNEGDIDDCHHIINSYASGSATRDQAQASLARLLIIRRALQAFMNTTPSPSVSTEKENHHE